MNIGDSLIPFSLPGVDGKTHSTDDYTSKAVLVVIFSCNHCPYVKAWEDRMVQIQADYAEQGVQFLAINANDTVKYPADSFEAMKVRAAEKASISLICSMKVSKCPRPMARSARPKSLCSMPIAPCVITAPLTTITKIRPPCSAPICARRWMPFWPARRRR